jgi:carbamoyl-phosphate synthase small subunit
MDLARVVSVAASYEWTAGNGSLGGYRAAPTPHWHVVAYDFGVKHNICACSPHVAAR